MARFHCGGRRRRPCRDRLAHRRYRRGSVRPHRPLPPHPQRPGDCGPALGPRRDVRRTPVRAGGHRRPSVQLRPPVVAPVLPRHRPALAPVRDQERDLGGVRGRGGRRAHPERGGAGVAVLRGVRRRPRGPAPRRDLAGGFPHDARRHRLGGPRPDLRRRHAPDDGPRSERPVDRLRRGAAGGHRARHALRLQRRSERPAGEDRARGHRTASRCGFPSSTAGRFTISPNSSVGRRFRTASSPPSSRRPTISADGPPADRALLRPDRASRRAVRFRRPVAPCRRGRRSRRSSRGSRRAWPSGHRS